MDIIKLNIKLKLFMNQSEVRVYQGNKSTSKENLPSSCACASAAGNKDSRTK